jgi:molecular chaperone DnaK
LAALNEALNGTDIEAIKSATDKLLSASQSFSARLYEEAAKSHIDEPAAPAGDDEDIVDAEIVDE